jgi:hypothetical protein
VGRHGEALLAVYEDPDTSAAYVDQLDYGSLLPDVDELRKWAREAGLREVARRGGIREQTLSDWVNGATSSEDVVVAVAMVVDEIEVESVRICALEGCDRPVPNPRAKWCTAAHRAKGSRVQRGLTGWGKPRPTWDKEAERERAWRESHP